MLIIRSLFCWAVVAVCASLVSPVQAQIWPTGYQMKNSRPAALSPHPAPAPPDTVSPSAPGLRETALLPSPSAMAMSGLEGNQKPDNGPVGHRFLPPPPAPLPPGGLSIVANPAADPAQNGTPLTLSEALTLAALHNPTLTQAQAQVEASLGLAVQAGLWPNPTLVYTGMKIGSQGTPGEFQGAQLRQEIITADKRDISRAKFLQASKAAEWMAVEQQWRVCNDVRVHYWTTLGQRELIAIQREILKNAEDHVVTAQEQWNLGQSTRADLHMANAKLQEMRLNLLLAENNYVQAYETLVAQIGIPLEARYLSDALEGEFIPVAFEALLADYYAESPQILRTRTRLRETHIALKRELVEPVPNVFVQAGPGYDFTERETVANAQLWFDLPVFNRNQGNIRRGEADIVHQQAEIKRIELLLRQELAGVYRNYLTALQHVEQYQAVILPEAREAYKVQLDAYKEDRQNWGDVLAMQKAYFDLRSAYVMQLVALRTNETLLRGYLLHGGLASPTNTMSASFGMGMPAVGHMPGRPLPGFGMQGLPPQPR